MNDAQLISIAITLFAVAAGSIFNNVRISDSNSAMGKRIDDMGKRIDDTRDLLNARFDEVNRKLDRIADTLMAMLSDHEQRIRALEQQRPR